jgi:creatinine amidohydrolase
MKFAELTWPAIHALPRTTPVVIPVAAVEQHGRHLPVYTDSMLLGEVVRRVENRIGDRLLVAPLLWLGNSHHHLDFGGTLSASPRGYLDLLADLTECFLGQGFTRIVFLNGHGGNTTPGKQALFEVRQTHRERQDLLLLFATYWNASTAPRKLGPEFVQTDMGHACEWETSMILRLAPQLVGPVGQLEKVGFEFGFEPAYRAWTTRDRTEPGHIGDPRHATAEKGERLFEVFADEVSTLLQRVIAWDGAAWKV